MFMGLHRFGCGLVMVVALSCGSGAWADGDECPPSGNDCDGNGQDDLCEIEQDPSLDCNGNFILDVCDIDLGISQDSDGNGVPDDCEIPMGSFLLRDANGDPIGTGVFENLAAFLQAVKIRMNDIIVQLQASPDPKAELVRDEFGRVRWSSGSNWQADLIEELNQLYTLLFELTQVQTNLLQQGHDARDAIVNQLKSSGPSGGFFEVLSQPLELGPWSLDDVDINGLGAFHVTLDLPETFVADRAVELRDLLLSGGAVLESEFFTVRLTNDVAVLSPSSGGIVRAWGDAHLAAIDDDQDGVIDSAMLTGPGGMDFIQALVVIQGLIDDMQMTMTNATMLGNALKSVGPGVDGGSMNGSSYTDWAFDIDGTFEWSGGVLEGEQEQGIGLGSTPPDLANDGDLFLTNGASKSLVNGIVRNAGVMHVMHDDVFDAKAELSTSVARIHNDVGGLVDVTGNGRWAVNQSGSSGLLEVVNDGHMHRSAGAGEHSIEGIPVVNRGLIECSSGQFTMWGGLDLDGGQLRANAATISFSNGLLQLRDALLEVSSGGTLALDGGGVVAFLDGDVQALGDGAIRIEPGFFGAVADGISATVSTSGPMLTLGNGVLGVPSDSSLMLEAISAEGENAAVELKRCQLAGDGMKSVRGALIWRDGLFDGPAVFDSNAAVLLTSSDGFAVGHLLRHGMLTNHGRIVDDAAQRWSFFADVGETTTLFNAVDGIIEWSGPTWLQPTPGGSPGLERFVNEGLVVKPCCGGTSSIGGGFEWINRGTMRIESGGVQSFSSLGLESGAVELVGEDTFLSTASTVQSGGVIAGHGTLSGAITSTGGSWSPGLEDGSASTTGALLLLSDLVMESSAELVIDLAGLVANDQYDQIVSSRFVTSNGASLRVRLREGFVPEIDDAFTVVDTSFGFNGSFGTLFLPALPFGRTWSVETTTHDVILRVVAGGIPGDVNGDGVVNTDDLLLLLATWGACDGCPADIDGDGDVDTDDLLSLLANWG